LGFGKLMSNEAKGRIHFIFSKVFALMAFITSWSNVRLTNSLIALMWLFVFILFLLFGYESIFNDYVDCIQDKDIPCESNQWHIFSYYFYDCVIHKNKTIILFIKVKYKKEAPFLRRGFYKLNFIQY